MTLRTIIVEDEPLSLLFLKSLLAEYCPQVEVIASAAAEDEAVDIINEMKPGLVLMDIELQQGNGFSVLQRTAAQGYHIIFTTALDYAGIRAIRFSGAAYLQKPIDLEALQSAVAPLVKRPEIRNDIAIAQLLATLENNNQPRSLLLNTTDGAYYILLDDIIYIRATAGDCIFYTPYNAVTAMHSSIKEFELLLQEEGFFRPHADYIIRLNKVASFSATGDNIIMKNEATVPVSPKKTDQLHTLLLSPVL